MPTEKSDFDVEMELMALSAQMRETPGVGMMKDLIAVGGRELADPLFRDGVYFDQFKQDLVNWVLHFASHDSYDLDDVWHEAVSIFSEINAELSDVGAPAVGVSIPSYDEFIDQLRLFDRAALDFNEEMESSRRNDYVRELSDDEYRLLKQCSRVEARRKQIRDRGKPLAPLYVMPGSEQEALLKSHAKMLIDGAHPERFVFILLITKLERAMNWRFDNSSEAAWRELLRDEVSGSIAKPRLSVSIG